MTSESRHADVEAALDDLGLPFDAQPRERLPELPSDLTELTESRLMGLMVNLTNWAAYAAGQLARAAVAEKHAEADLAMAQARAAVAARGEKSVSAQKAAAAADPEVQEATDRLTEAYALRKSLEAVHGGLEAKAKVVSRDLTRRTGLSATEHRAGKWGT
jgi:hypothetical protein